MTKEYIQIINKHNKTRPNASNIPAHNIIKTWSNIVAHDMLPHVRTVTIYYKMLDGATGLLAMGNLLCTAMLQYVALKYCIHLTVPYYGYWGHHVRSQNCPLSLSRFSIMNKLNLKENLWEKIIKNRWMWLLNWLTKIKLNSEVKMIIV